MSFLALLAGHVPSPYSKFRQSFRGPLTLLLPNNCLSPIRFSSLFLPETKIPTCEVVRPPVSLDQKSSFLEIINHRYSRLPVSVSFPVRAPPSPLSRLRTSYNCESVAFLLLLGPVVSASVSPSLCLRYPLVCKWEDPPSQVRERRRSKGSDCSMIRISSVNRWRLHYYFSLIHSLWLYTH